MTVHIHACTRGGQKAGQIPFCIALHRIFETRLPAKLPGLARLVYQQVLGSPCPYFPGARVPEVGQHTGFLTRVLGIKLQFSHFHKYSTLPVVPPPWPHRYRFIYRAHWLPSHIHKDGPHSLQHLPGDRHLIAVLMCIVFRTRDTELFFKYLLVLCMSPFESCLLRSFIYL